MPGIVVSTMQTLTHLGPRATQDIYVYHWCTERTNQGTER